MYVNFTIKIILHTPLSLKKNGKGAIYFRFTQNRIPNIFSLGEVISIKNWKGKEDEYLFEKGVNRHPDAKNINFQLQETFDKAKKIKRQAKINNEFVSYESFRKKIKGNFGSVQNATIKELWPEFIAYLKTEKVTAGTLKNWKGFKKHLTAYSSENQVVHQIDEFFARKWFQHKQDVDNNNHNSAKKNLDRLFKFLKFAVKFGVKMDLDFIDDFSSIKNEKTIVYGISELELKKFEHLFDIFSSIIHQNTSNPNLKRGYKYFDKQLKENVEISYLDIEHLHRNLRHFLAACHTGMDFNDMSSVVAEDMILEADFGYIHRIRGKSKNQYLIPLTPKAKKYIDTSKKSGRIFDDIITNQKMNKSLKRLAKIADVGAYVTFHKARHTFATNAINNGLTTEEIAEMLGHSSTKMTKKYAKLRKSNILRNIKKLEKK